MASDEHHCFLRRVRHRSHQKGHRPDQPFPPGRPAAPEDWAYYFTRGVPVMPSRGRKAMSRGELSRRRKWTFTEIYRELAFALSWDPEMCRSAEGVELELESETIIANPHASRMVEAARQAGKRVVFISDIYLPADFIRGQLDRLGLARDGDQCYVSSAHRVTKASGRLFELLLKGERVQPWEITHVGDHASSDDAVPRRMGLATLPYIAARPNRYEAAMASFAVETDGLSGVFAGAARAARLCGRMETEREAALWEAGTGVVGPVLSAYVLWVLKRARKAGLERLYFLSRDGYILRKIGQQLAPAVGGSIDLRYICGSRQAWHLPAIKSLGPEHLAWLLDPTHGMTIRHILSRVEMSPEEVASKLAAGGFPDSRWDLPLAENERSWLAQILMSPFVADMVATRAEGPRKLALAYFRQEGLTDGVPWGLVDLGWNGRLQSSLHSLIGPELGHPIKGFYFALHKKPTGVGTLEEYLSARQAGVGALESHMHASIDGNVLHKLPHGRTTAYRGTREPRRTGFRRPALGGASGEWGVEIVHAATLEFARQLAQSVGNCSIHSDLRQMILELVRVWWTLPDLPQARAWGAFPYEDDQAAGMCELVATPLSWMDCARACRRRGFWWPRSRIEWCQASLVLTSTEKVVLARAVNRTWKALSPLRRVIREIIPRQSYRTPTQPNTRIHTEKPGVHETT